MTTANPHITAALMELLARYGLSVPAEGKFKNSRLDTVLKKRETLPSLRAALKWELKQAQLLDD